MSANAFPAADKQAVYDVIRERRDIRSTFTMDPIDDATLIRVLGAAHLAPSVGFSQPWDFVLVRDEARRRRIQRLAQRQRDDFAASLPSDRQRMFDGLKIEAICSTPLNVVITCDPTRGGPHTIGRHADPRMTSFSTATAVQNLWLAARAEGLGVGWVSFFDPHELARELELPEHLEVVAYLCVGHVSAFPPAPELQTTGWARRRPLSWAVHDETWSSRTLPGGVTVSLLDETVAAITPADPAVLARAQERQAQLTKPAGAMGLLESTGERVAAAVGEWPPPMPSPVAIAVFAGDHGVHAQGVSPWPQEVSVQMAANIAAGGAVVNAAARQVGAEVDVVDVGLAADLPPMPGLLVRKVARGTADATRGPAITPEQCQQAIEVGIDVARDLVAQGNRLLVAGEVGIGNTTPAAALVSVFTGRTPDEVTGTGAGLDEPGRAAKAAVVARAIEVNRASADDPLHALAAVGGLEHAAMVGFLLAAAAQRTPVVLDGVISCSAALVAQALAPQVTDYLVAGHAGVEPGILAALSTLGLEALVDLDLRLGEGSGAALAVPLVQMAVRMLREVATFESAAVSGKDETPARVTEVEA
ncbi:nicotinate-nucleotide--dimethylbenzimidazole phosphoribosyltransferase [Arsenicicoccus sp. oral taxon 190]|uniref:nicotinate-nucleotide--dimethylbenzimidazole phosphoribosyltransferase n=1 Tax=Arsenicicoccus sp. oral taxon 190 TaxID=1658671 RepID=UPI000679EAFC|nr:nicotinate-nucleotide--dimethylbenzimidazole phosphoribosyltransferase [Arsenicicoccus sp. oral taxon 190]AKT52074.1 nicotinate-nucleotide--dimethylbenzimidazole phosphoribosyltransferase [Arsenicicoccus sp. oral taxon 190]